MADIPMSYQPPVQQRRVPISDADYNAGITAPTWSDPSRTPGLNQKVTRKYFLTDADGKPVVDEKTGERAFVTDSLLNIFEIFTQDVRMGNLGDMEIEFVVMHLDLAHDLLHSGYVETSMVVLERAISVLETSHSKRGWFRKIMGTVRSENYHEMYEPKKNFFTGKKE